MASSVTTSSALPGSSSGKTPPPAPTPVETGNNGRRLTPAASLRRHLVLAMGIALAIWMIGAPIAWFFGQKIYLSEAVIFVSPRFLKNLESDLEQEMQSNSQYREFVQQQVKSVARYDILAEALRKNPRLMEWWRHNRESDQHAIERLQGSLLVKAVPDTYQITIGLEDHQPENLAEMVNAVIDEFLHRDKQDELYGKDQRIVELRKEAVRLNQEVTSLIDRRTQIAEELGVTTFNEGLINPYDRLLIDGQEALAEVRRRRIERESELASIDNSQRSRQGTLRELARDQAVRDQGLISLKANLNVRRSELMARVSGLGPSHPGRLAAENEISEIDIEIERQMARLIESYSAMLVEQRRSTVDQLRRSEAEMERTVQVQADKARWFTMNYQEALSHGVEVERLRKRLGAVDDRINFLSLEANAPGFMRVFANARRPETPIRGGRERLALLFLGAGLVLAIAIPVAADYLDPRVHTATELEESLGLPTIGSLVRIADPITRNFARDQRWRIAGALDRAHRTSDTRIILLTSAEPGAGTSTLTLGLARTLVERGISAIALEANAFKPDKRYVDGAGSDSVQREGLATILQNGGRINGQILPAKGALPDRLPVGETNGTSHLPSGTDLSRVLRLLASRYNMVLIDAPPLSLSPDTEMLATLADAVILVVAASSTCFDEVRQLARHLERLNPSTIGVLLNRVDPRRDPRTASLLAEHRTGSQARPTHGLLSWLWN